MTLVRGCFVCGRPCVGQKADHCEFVTEFCDDCLQEIDYSTLHTLMEARHASECGCTDDAGVFATPGEVSPRIEIPVA